MLRQIAKQEADKRMAKFREEMASVKQERDRYKEQLELMEEEFVKERQGKLDLKEEMQRMQGTVEELQARHAEASKVPDDAGHGKAEDTVKYQSQIATLKAEISSLEVRIKSHESNASTTTSRHEEILSEALQAAAQQSDRAEGLEAKLNTATEKITKLEEEASQHAATINTMQSETMILMENAVNAEKKSQETLLQQSLDEKKKEWEEEKLGEFETSLSFWQKRWESDKKLAVENAISKTLEESRQRFHSEKKAAIELAKMDAESSLRKEHNLQLQQHQEESMAKQMAAQASLAALEAKCEQLQDKVDELRQAAETEKRARHEMVKSHEDEMKALRSQFTIDLDRSRTEIQQKERRWETLDRAKDMEFEEEMKRMTISTATKHQEEMSAKLEALRQDLKKQYEEPEDEKWATVDLSAHPVPPMNLRSPVVLHILDHWTDDPNRIKFMQAWLNHIVSGQPVDSNNKKFRQGLELAHLKPEVCDGFEKIIFPLLQKRGDIAIKAMRRTQRETWKDLRIKVMPKQQYVQDQIASVQRQHENRASPAGTYRSPAFSADSNDRHLASDFQPRTRNRGRTLASTPDQQAKASPNTTRRNSFSSGGDISSSIFKPPSKKPPKPPQ